MPLPPDVRVFDFRGAQLGINISDTANGVRVDQVNAGSPAEKAGLRTGDLMVEFDGERVRSAMQLTRLVHETPAGRQVAMAVMRDGKRQTLQATLEAAPAEAGSRLRGDVLRELERSLRDLPPEYRVQPPIYRYDDFPRRYEYRLPDPGSRFGSRGRLGVSVQSLTPELEDYFGAKNGGALVSSVAPESAAARAGVKAGDVITTINGRSIADASDLTRELRNLTGEVTIGLLRDKKALTLKATLNRVSGVL
jgi:serine protease Do